MGGMERSARAADGGFTLIELLVVVVIIGVLAAIAIPTFLNQRRRGWQTANISEIRNVVLALESYSADNGGRYLTVDSSDGTGMAALRGLGYNVSAPYRQGQGIMKVKLPSPTTYCVEVAHPALVDFTYTSPAPWGWWAKDQTMAQALPGYCDSDGTQGFNPG